MPSRSQALSTARSLAAHPLLRDYLTILSGSVGRLAISLVYFLVVANALSLADFGLFATASAVGVVVARIGAFGFVSPLFRAATVRRRMVGTYMAGYLALLALSLPVMALAAWLAWLGLFRGAMGLGAFALVVAAEAVAWRLVEVVAIVNNGLRRFGAAAMLVLAGSAVRTLAALAFWMAGEHTLDRWALVYLAANALSAVLAWALFLPPLRLRWRPRVYARRMADALSAASADIVFYLQAELDKAVVLAMAGPRVAGLYAIVMRIVDLTAMPVRSFNQLVMQKIMGDRGFRAGAGLRAGLEAGVAAVSTLALAAVIVLLWLFPGALGRNVGEAGALFSLVIAVPAFRNLIEYHAELLYARERTALRAALLALIAVLKAALTAALIVVWPQTEGWFAGLNGAFAALYALSAAVTYGAIRAGSDQAGSA